MKLYGIPNCNTVKKARAWLADQGLTVEFHDFKKQGISVAKLEEWSTCVGWEKLLNRQGTTWRQLPDATKTGIKSQEGAIALMQEKPSVIKRPVLEINNTLLVGFDEATYRAAFASGK